MNQTADTIIMQPPTLSLTERTATLASWVLSGALFLSVGWMAMAPDDPHGAVSVYTRSDSLAMLAQAAALCAVVAALATVMAGRRLVDAGTFAAAVGLSAVSLRGGTAEFMLLTGVEHQASQRMLGLKFAGESLMWVAVMLLSLVVAGVVTRWCFGRTEGAGARGAGDSSWTEPVPAGCDLPIGRFGPLAPVAGDGATPLADGLRHTTIAGVGGLAAMVILSTGLGYRSILAGQVCFVVAASVAIGAYFASRFAPVRSALWSILAVGLMALVGYVWSALKPVSAGLPPHVPSTSFLRILPLQFVGVGSVSAVATFWYCYMPPPDHAVNHRR